MRTVRHPIVMFITAVIGLIAIGVGVLAAAGDGGLPSTETFTDPGVLSFSVPVAWAGNIGWVTTLPVPIAVLSDPPRYVMCGGTSCQTTPTAAPKWGASHLVEHRGRANRAVHQVSPRCLRGWSPASVEHRTAGRMWQTRWRDNHSFCCRLIICPVSDDGVPTGAWTPTASGGSSRHGQLGQGVDRLLKRGAQTVGSLVPKSECPPA